MWGLGFRVWGCRVLGIWGFGGILKLHSDSRESPYRDLDFENAGTAKGATSLEGRAPAFLGARDACSGCKALRKSLNRVSDSTFIRLRNGASKKHFRGEC